MGDPTDDTTEQTGDTFVAPQDVDTAALADRLRRIADGIDAAEDTDRRGGIFVKSTGTSTTASVADASVTTTLTVTVEPSYTYRDVFDGVEFEDGDASHDRESDAVPSFDATTVRHPGGEPEVWSHDPIRNPDHARRVAEAILDTHGKIGITDHADTVDLALDVWGEPRQLATLSEEANELSRAIVRYLNHRPKAGMSDIVEEAADVWVGIEHIRQIIGDDRFDDAAVDAFQSLRAKAAAADSDPKNDHDFPVDGGGDE